MLLTFHSALLPLAAVEPAKMRPVMVTDPSAYGYFFLIAVVLFGLAVCVGSFFLVRAIAQKRSQEWMQGSISQEDLERRGLSGIKGSRKRRRRRSAKAKDFSFGD